MDKNNVNIRVVGDVHGNLDKVYKDMQDLDELENIKTELLLCCGDFESARDEADLSSMVVPRREDRMMKDFWQYYNGEKTAPCKTIFIGGNHEASNFLQELPYGGWVAPEVFYMGYANVVTFKGIRIGGISGIYNKGDYHKGHFEKPPYNFHTKRSVYHVRSSEVFRLSLLQNPVDIVMSHDWPNGIERYGDIAKLLCQKPKFVQNIMKNRLGSPPLMELLHHMKPKLWLSGHMHVNFTATVNHNSLTQNEGIAKTFFRGGDACRKNAKRPYLQLITTKARPNQTSDQLSYDAEWLAVLKATNDLNSMSNKSAFLRHPTAFYNISCEKVENIKGLFSGNLTIPKNFKHNMKLYEIENHNEWKKPYCSANNQTTEFCAKLDINDPLIMTILGDWNKHNSLHFD